MWKQIVVIVLVLAFVVFAVSFFYSQLPGEPVNLEVVESGQTEEEIEIDYGVTPVFSKNLRFNHNLISYYIESNCSAERKQKMKEAFAIFHDEINIISFYETQKTNADILVGCSRDYADTENGMFIAGEGGPSKFLDNDLFNIILEGKITLFRESECDDYPVVELHELLHVFGFNHINNIKSIMHNVSKCDQRITPDMIDTLNSLYVIEPLPDIYIDDVNAVKKRYYLDFNITVKNKGLVDAGRIMLKVSTESGKAKEFEMGDLTIFASRTLSVENLKLPSRSDELIIFEIFEENNVSEIDKGNNRVEMVVDD